MKNHLFATWNAPQFTKVIPLALRFVFPVSQSLQKQSRALQKQSRAVLIAVALACAGGSSLCSSLSARAADVTILNPTPGVDDLFGQSFTVVGNNVLIGAGNDDTTGSDGGAAYLMDGTTGALLETYFSPVSNSMNFGRQVTSFSEGPFANDILVAGNDLSSSFGLRDRVFQLDATTGALKNTYVPPNRAEHLDSFGAASLSIATQGDQILIGSRYVIQDGVNSVGAAYLYDAGTGNLLHTFRPPTKIDHLRFGGSVAFAGDKIVIGTVLSTSEEIFVYDRSDNSLSYTIQDPNPFVPDDSQLSQVPHFFGDTLTADGNYLLVGSPRDDTAGTRAGAAYLFDVNTGNLLQSFFNPTPPLNLFALDGFGGSVALQGNNVLIGAQGDDTAQGARSGAAYLFDTTTGDLVNTFLRPTAEDVTGSNGFASSVGFLGDRVIIGDANDNTGAQAAGVVHLFPQTASPHSSLPLLPFNGQLLVASSATDNVLQYDGTTGAFVNVFAQFGEIDGPQAMTFGPDGNLFVASLNSTSGPDFSPLITVYDGTTGGYLGVFASGTNLPDVFKDMAFGPDDNLYVACFCFSQELLVGQPQVRRYDGNTGAFIDAFASGGGLDSPSGILFGPDGNLYVSNASSDEVLRYDGTTGDFIDVFASGGGLDSPQVLAFGPDNNLYVTSALTDNVLRYDGTTGAFIDVFASGGGLDGPRGLAFGPDGDLYVTSLTSQVLRYDGTTGAFVDVFASGSGLSDPTYLLFRPVPEPSMLMLSATTAVCLLGFGWRRRGGMGSAMVCCDLN